MKVSLKLSTIGNDKDIDAINEPYRPIPSGALSQSDVFAQSGFLLFGGIALALGLDF